jgi:hypothetical protein
VAAGCSWSPTTSAINATLYRRLPFEFVKDVAPSRGWRGWYTSSWCAPSVPANTPAELIASVIEKSGIKGSL